MEIVLQVKGLVFMTKQSHLPGPFGKSKENTWNVLASKCVEILYMVLEAFTKNVKCYNLSHYVAAKYLIAFKPDNLAWYTILQWVLAWDIQPITECVTQGFVKQKT